MSADEYSFVKLAAEGTFDAFHTEAGKLLAETLSARHGSLPVEVIDDAVRLNHALVNQPFATGNRTLELRYDLPGYRHAVRNGEQAPLREAPIPDPDRDRPSWQALRRFPDGAARSSGGAARRGLSLFAGRERDRSRARRPLLTCSFVVLQWANERIGGPADWHICEQVRFWRPAPC